MRIKTDDSFRLNQILVWYFEKGLKRLWTSPNRISQRRNFINFAKLEMEPKNYNIFLFFKIFTIFDNLSKEFEICEKLEIY